MTKIDLAEKFFEFVLFRMARMKKIPTDDMAKKIFDFMLFRAVRFLPDWYRNSLGMWKTMAYDMGHMKTIREQECRDASGAPLPWYTYPAIDYLNQMDLRNKRVFEYGCGFSTLFWASKAARVTSVENDADWYEKIRSLSPGNVDLHLATDPEMYVRAVLDERIGDREKYDIIIIDGYWRHQAARTARPRLKDEGFIILDNADWYPRTLRWLIDSGLLRVDMIGFSPINPYTLDTAFLFSPGHRPIFRDKVIMKGGVDHVAEDDE
ncbi:MAG TPA: SAM-dependent methyltransferase [bacterium]|nr:SAM-dependent methyltransferase [bacterium]